MLYLYIRQAFLMGDQSVIAAPRMLQIVQVSGAWVSCQHGKGIENQVAGVGGNLHNPLDQAQN